ncbi:penicillin-insensitive murein endopeptidase [bacterium]|nr:penicillin-insensitive murein endopeptidase [bacterium]
MKPWLVSLLLLLAPPAGAETLAAKLFAAQLQPTSGPAEPIGTYARGCAAGNVELPETGPTWQAMRLSRDRNWGSPVLVSYLEDLSHTVTQFGWRGLYIGDMGNPRGGPMISGHASHQMGLDADVWFLPPSRLDLSRAAREKISSISIRTDDQLRVNQNWNPSYREILKAAASDPRVDRIFVAAAIKLEICKTAKPSDTKWLQHLRPEAGHEDHFHVRLKCPPGSALCQTQSPTVSELSKGGNGCDETLNYWVSDAYLHPKPVKNPGPKPPHRKGPREFTMADLPPQCSAVLSAN